MRYFYELLWFSPEVVEESEINVFFFKTFEFIWWSYGIFYHEEHLINMISSMNKRPAKKYNDFIRDKMIIIFNIFLKSYSC